MSTLALRTPYAATLRDLVALTKPRITFLVVVTALGGLWIAPVRPSFAETLVLLLAMAAVVSSANALNCWFERDVDKHMTRTRNRPLPAGRLSPRLALGFGLLLGALAVPALSILVNPLTGALGALALVMYVWMYTPLKQRTPAALFVGAVPGALPPLMGWTAATGSLDNAGLVLFAVLFLWQIPHFLAIALFRGEEYTRAGIRVYPQSHGAGMTRVQMALFSGALIPVSLLLAPTGVVGRTYSVAALILGLMFFAVSVSGFFSPIDERRWARRVFGVSLLYLVALFAVLAFEGA